MGRTLVIVSRDKPDLFHYLRESYRTREARVILDRRAKERRERMAVREFAGAERRRQADADTDLAFRREVTPPFISRLAPARAHQFSWRGGSASDSGFLPVPGLTP